MILNLNIQPSFSHVNRRTQFEPPPVSATTNGHIYNHHEGGHPSHYGTSKPNGHLAWPPTKQALQYEPDIAAHIQDRLDGISLHFLYSLFIKFIFFLKNQFKA
jgi:hypothetical protein